MICQKCGFDNPEGDVFCGNCGNKLEAASSNLDAAFGTDTASDSALNQAADEATISQPVDSQPAEPVVTEVPAQDQQASGQPVQNQADQQAYNQPAPQQTKPVKQKKPMDPGQKKMLITISCVVGALLLMCIIFFTAITKATDYKLTASQFFKYETEGDYGKAYDLLSIKDKSEFITKDAFKTIHANDEKKDIVIKSVQTYDTKSSASKEKVVYIKYQYKDRNATEEARVTMVESGRFMLFFKKYKVDPSTVIASDIKIRAYTNADVVINGTTVDKKYIKSDESTDSYDAYVIPEIFMGTSEIKFTSSIMEEHTIKEEIVYDKQSFSFTSPKVSKDEQNKLAEQAKKDYTSILAAAVDKKKFTEINGLFSKKSNYATKAEQTYDKLVKKFNIDEKTNGYKTIKPTSFTNMDEYDSHTDDGIQAKVSMSVNYSGNYQSRSYSSAIHDYEVKYEEKKGSTSAYIYYIYDDGKWTIKSMSLGI